MRDDRVRTRRGAAGGWCELHCHTPFSLRAAGSSIEALVGRAVALGYPALAITDTMTLAGVVRFHAACRSAAIRPITGCELLVRDPAPPDDATDAAVGTWLALARDRAGCADLCGLLTRANLADPARPAVPLDDLAAHADGLALLVGGCDGPVQRLLTNGRVGVARALLARYAGLFGAAPLSLEVRHTLLPDAGLLLARSVALAREAGIRCVATNGARHATPDEYRVYDLLTCIRQGTTVDEPHPAGPHNAEAHLKAADELRPLFAPYCPEALPTAATLAEDLRVELLAERCISPRVPLPAGHTLASYLRALCEGTLPERYPAPVRHAGQRQLDRELDVIGRLGLGEFFLVVWDIVREARARGIRCAGRGSAANSIVAYLLGITQVDPLRHRLLFERFLNVERAGTPDIDVDVQSSRRQELIDYAEATYAGHEAMVANVVTYRLRLAVRDAAKALGFPLPVVGRLTRVLPPFAPCADVGRYASDLTGALERAVDDPVRRAGYTARLRRLIELVPRLDRFPRHLSLPNGGLLLARRPLGECLPLRRSANGVLAVELDKDDVEAVGLIKFDLLGLRAYDAIERCLDLIQETEGERPDVDGLPLDQPDPAAMGLIRSGRTLGVFQLESPAQWNLLARTLPETFEDLVIQTSLCRPSPIQAGMVHPYIARRRGRARVIYAHPALEPILRDTLGIVLFQEQVLEIAHAVAGLSYGKADGFRKAMSHYRTRSEMEGMRGRFVRGAVGRGISTRTAMRIFDEIACFVGYGFCRSHAAAFARGIYQTAYLNACYPAHFLAAFLSSQPCGFFPPSTVLHEARLSGIALLPVDVQHSGEQYTVERLEGEGSMDDAAYAIRVGFAQVKEVGDELAHAIVAERAAGDAYRSLADFCARVVRRAPLRSEAVAALVAAGAFDGLGIPRRRLGWLLGERWRDWNGQRSHRRGRRSEGEADREGCGQYEQAILPWTWPDERAEEAPRLPPLTLQEQVEWDLATQCLSPRPHPLALRRRELAAVGVLPIAELGGLPDGRRALVVGLVIAAQRPPTAKGVAFLTLEDESGRVQAVVPPSLAGTIRLLLAESRTLAVSGRIERSEHAGQGSDHVTLLARVLRPVPPIIPAASRSGMRSAPGGVREGRRASRSGVTGSA